MYAIIEAVGKQYKVLKGEKVKIDLVDEEHRQEGAIFFDKVLLTSDNGTVVIGQPYVKDVYVEGNVLGEFKDDKVVVYKYKRKTGYHKKQGHRQNYTVVEIVDIKFGVPAIVEPVKKSEEAIIEPVGVRLNDEKLAIDENIDVNKIDKKRTSRKKETE